LSHSSLPIHIEFKRKKNSSATVRDGEIVLRIASHLTRSERERHIQTLTERMQHKLARTSSNKTEPDLTDGTVLTIFGQRLMLHLITDTSRKVNRIEIQQKAIRITLNTTLSSAELHALLRSKLARHFQPTLVDFVQKLNKQTVNSPRLAHIRFRQQRSRWGSCSVIGNINISSRLLFLPQELLGYVCLHELCHLKEMNHSGRYWALVKKFMPEYEKYRKELKSYLI